MVARRGIFAYTHKRAKGERVSIDREKGGHISLLDGIIYEKTGHW